MFNSVDVIVIDEREARRNQVLFVQAFPKTSKNHVWGMVVFLFLYCDHNLPGPRLTQIDPKLFLTVLHVISGGTGNYLIMSEQSIVKIVIN